MHARRTWIAIAISVSLLMVPIASSKADVIITTLGCFDVTNGAAPQTYGDALTFAPNGNIYGTTSTGGASNTGTIFRINPGGALTTLYSFKGGSDGALPLAGLTLAADGKFYGTTHGGSTNGTLFKIDTNGTFTTLVTFNSTNGARPVAPLTQGKNGNLYGTTFYGGADGVGTVFQLDTNGQFTTLFAFSGTNGANPTGPLLQTSDGTLYGTTAYGGIGFSGPSSGYGTAFSLQTNGFLNTIVFFNGTNGDNPYSGLIKATDGNFYGTTAYGGIGFANIVKSGQGTVFRIAGDGSFTTLTFITNTGTSGLYEGLLEGRDGNFYGASGGQAGPGEVFRVSKEGFYSTLLQFASSRVYTNSRVYYLNGEGPFGRLVEGADGDFYGTTCGGGVYDNWASGQGTIFRLSVPLQPSFQSITRDDGLFALRWDAVAGQVYQVQYSTDPFHADWNNLGDAFTPTNRTVTTFDAPGDTPKRFYRISVLP